MSNPNTEQTEREVKLLKRARSYRRLADGAIELLSASGEVLTTMRGKFNDFAGMPTGLSERRQRR